MLKKLEELSGFIGNTPMRRLGNEDATLHAKLEYVNFSGSSKDRPAYNIIYNGIRTGKIKPGTTLIASSSGNLAIAVASICKFLNLRFIPVIDPNINPDYEVLLKLLSYQVVKVTERDKTGGYLLTRIAVVDQMCTECPDSFCVDQYTDPNNYRAYYKLAHEVMDTMKTLNYIFVAVSSGGAITGISKCVKAKRPDVRIIGVDVEGSVVFGAPPKKRYISGIGSSQVSPIMKNAIVDDVMIVSQMDVVNGCMELLNEQAIFGGGSSGAVYFAAKKYLHENRQLPDPVAILVLPDKGSAYLDSIYNKDWVHELALKVNGHALI